LSIIVGVLALQGAVREHLRMIEACGAKGIAVKKSDQLSKIDALIIPGGESTTIGKLVIKYGFDAAIHELKRKEIPLYGTCAGLILLANRISNLSGATDKREPGEKAAVPPLLGLIDIEVERNAFGRQRESFEADLEIPIIGSPSFRGVFIRAPRIESVGPNVEVLARFEEKIVMARMGKILVTAFHPELTNDHRIHKYFIQMIKTTASQRM